MKQTAKKTGVNLVKTTDEPQEFDFTPIVESTKKALDYATANIAYLKPRDRANAINKLAQAGVKADAKDGVYEVKTKLCKAASVWNGGENAN
ncbi:MAG: hypothetical protein HUK22_05390 [Thermoguttaceae bacterium]|nr:hypothetical protein [Thermoguttaceae bacterium]